MKQAICLAAVAATSVLATPAFAASVKLGVDDSLVTINDRVAEARYKLDQTNWDMMLSNGAEPITSADITTKNIGNATQLNNVTWDFSISYESGNDGVQGFTYTLTDVAYGGSTTETLTFDVNSPLNGLIPTGSFNAIQIQARAGALRNSLPGTSAYLDISNLTFTSGLPSSGSLADPLSAFTPPTSADNNITWITSDMNLGDVDWNISGTVQGGFTCDGGGTGCLRGESVKMNFKFADATVVPVPAAVWLFGSALGLLGWSRRR